MSPTRAHLGLVYLAASKPRTVGTKSSPTGFVSNAAMVRLVAASARPHKQMGGHNQ